MSLYFMLIKLENMKVFPMKKIEHYLQNTNQQINGGIIKMKGTIRKIIGFVLSLALCMSYRGSVTLAADQKSAESSGYAALWGRGQVANNAYSAGIVYLELQHSDGSGWKTATTITADKGKTNTTNSWTFGNSNCLFRVVIGAQDAPWFGNPGCIATGTVYTADE